MPASEWWYRNNNFNGTEMKYNLSAACIDRLQQELSQVDEELQLSGVSANQRQRALEGHAANIQRTMNAAFEAGKSRNSALAMAEDLTTDTLEAIIQGDAHSLARSMAKVNGVKASGGIPLDDSKLVAALKKIDYNKFVSFVHDKGDEFTSMPAGTVKELLKNSGLKDRDADVIRENFESNPENGSFSYKELTALLDAIKNVQSEKPEPKKIAANLWSPRSALGRICSIAMRLTAT